MLSKFGSYILSPKSSIFVHGVPKIGPHHQPTCRLRAFGPRFVNDKAKSFRTHFRTVWKFELKIGKNLDKLGRTQDSADNDAKRMRATTAPHAQRTLSQH